jgi:hypothetical protein
MKKKTMAALLIGGALVLGPLAGTAAAHPANTDASKAGLTDHCITVPLGSGGLQIEICYPT